MFSSSFSTDFDVHRNWMAITYNLPIARWYFDSTSPWTLDYPPFFAWFEYFLSQIASLFVANCEPALLELHATPYHSMRTLIFQRLSVIVTDGILFLALLSYLNIRDSEVPLQTSLTATISKNTYFYSSKQWCILTLAILNCGLLIVDHIHFQYNGILIGLLIYSISLVRQGRDLAAGVMFAILLNFKHLFLSMALVYFVYLFRHYCCWLAVQPLSVDDNDTHSNTCLLCVPTSCMSEMSEEPRKTDCKRHDSFRLFNFIRLSLAVLLVFTISLGPFVWSSFRDGGGTAAVVVQLGQLRDRLFPFGRGLMHAYWAPNVWAVYASVDRMLLSVKVRVPSLFVWSATSLSSDVPSVTRGLVGHASAQMAILPSPSPALVSIMCLLAIAPTLLKLWHKPHPRLFMASLVHASLSFFMLGWHVHEKAILVTLLPLTLTAPDSQLDSKLFLFASTIGHFSLFPLLFTPVEKAVKLLLFVIFFLLTWTLLNSELNRNLISRRIRSRPLTMCELLYLGGFIPVWLLTEILLPLICPAMEFLPLLLTSFYCALGNSYCWCLSWQIFSICESSLQFRS